MPPDPFPRPDRYQPGQSLGKAHRRLQEIIDETPRLEARIAAALEPVTVDPELDEWRTTYGRLDRVNDYPLRIIDWRPIAAGIAALALAVAARWTVRHGR